MWICCSFNYNMMAYTYTHQESLLNILIVEFLCCHLTESKETLLLSTTVYKYLRPPLSEKLCCFKILLVTNIAHNISYRVCDMLPWCFFAQLVPITMSFSLTSLTSGMNGSWFVLHEETHLAARACSVGNIPLSSGNGWAYL